MKVILDGVTCLADPTRPRPAASSRASRFVDPVVHVSGAPRRRGVCDRHSSGRGNRNGRDCPLGKWSGNRARRICGDVVVGAPAVGVSRSARAARGGDGRCPLYGWRGAQPPARRGLESTGESGERRGRPAAFPRRRRCRRARASGLDAPVYAGGGFGVEGAGGLCGRRADSGDAPAVSLGGNDPVSPRVSGRPDSTPGSPAPGTRAAESGRVRLRRVSGPAGDLLCGVRRGWTRRDDPKPRTRGGTGGCRCRAPVPPPANHAVRAHG